MSASCKHGTTKKPEHKLDNRSIKAKGGTSIWSGETSNPQPTELHTQTDDALMSEIVRNNDKDVWADLFAPLDGNNE